MYLLGGASRPLPVESGTSGALLNNDKPSSECQRLSLCHFVTADAGFWFALITTQLATMNFGQSAVLEPKVI